MDPGVKSRALSLIPYALYVVGVGREASIGCYTANWICQASFEPPLLMLGVKKGTRHHALIERDRVLTVNFLAADQKKIAALFMRWQEADDGRFGSFGFTTGRTGAPILDDAVAFVEAEVRRIVAGGDHDIVIAQVVEAGFHREEKPLLMSDTGWSYGG